MGVRSTSHTTDVACVHAVALLPRQLEGPFWPGVDVMPRAAAVVEAVGYAHASRHA
jgi:hypothetical protein